MGVDGSCVGEPTNKLKQKFENQLHLARPDQDFRVFLLEGSIYEHESTHQHDLLKKCSGNISLMRRNKQKGV